VHTVGITTEIVVLSPVLFFNLQKDCT